MAGVSNAVFNACEYLLDRRVEAGDGDRVAVTGPRGTHTYAGLLDLVRRAAAGLRDLGVRPEERVLIFMVDCPTMLGVILGAMRMGAVPVPVSTMLNGDDLAALLRDSRARVLVASEEFAPVVEKVVEQAVRGAPDLAVLVVDGQPPASAPPGVAGHDLDTVLAQPGGGDPYDTSPDASALWLYTSGTTGRPKAAMHRHANIRHVAELYGQGVLGITPNDLCYSVAKLFFAYGIGNSCFFPLSVGAATLLDPAPPTPDGVVQRVAEHRPTLFFGVPTFYAALLAADLSPDAFSTVRQAASAGEPLPPGLYQRFLDRFGVEILDGIGSTEALHIFLSNHPGKVRAGTTGTVVPGYELKILDDKDEAAAPGEPGALYVRGPSIATGYWCRTDTTRQVFQGEWLRTGDTYVADADGYHTCLGRTDDMIKPGGIWVSPSEVEGRLAEHPEVQAAAVVAVPDADGLDKPVACVVARPDAQVTADELVAFCRDRLAAFKRPRHVLFLDALPTTATGKIQRFVVRRLAADRLGAQPGETSTPAAAGTPA
ncbi:MAG: benzoate-CoA ligase family protein [Streptosporangiaceae bacterium]